MVTNDFVPFCNDNTGTNLLSQSAYLADPQLPTGNQPGIARSSLANKALRQATTIAAAIAQYTSNQSLADMLDNQNSNDHVISPAILGALTSALKFHVPVITEYVTGSGNHNMTYKFQIGTPTIAPVASATYTDGTTVFTVKTTVTGTQMDATGAASPVTAAGTLTKTGGTGDATLTYYAYRKPISIKVTVVGGGGAGGGVATTAAGTAGGAGGAGGGGVSIITINGPSGAYAYAVGAGGTAGAAGNNAGNAGGNSTFNTTVIGGGGAGGGGSGAAGTLTVATGGGVGGSASGGDINIPGMPGQGGIVLSSTVASSGYGGNSYLGMGAAGIYGGPGQGFQGTAASNYGGGGSGGEGNNVSARQGGVGAGGIVIVEENYQ